MDKARAAAVFTGPALEGLGAFPIKAGEIELVALGENVTFKAVDGASGEAFVLRLHRPGYNSLEELQSERVWTRALTEAGVRVPIGLAARDGRDFVSVAIPELGETRHVGVTSWTEGEVLFELLDKMQDTAVFQHRFEQLGAIAAALHNQSAAWRPPPGFTRHAVDADGLMGEAPFWGRFWEHPALPSEERALMLSTRERLHGALRRLGKDPATYGVIHADLHPGNLLADCETLTVIDFDDAAFGWHIYDIAVALTHYETRPDFPSIREAFLRGYRRHRPLAEEVTALLPMFLLIRRLAVIGWLMQRPEIDPGARLDEIRALAKAQCEAFEPPC